VSPSLAMGVDQAIYSRLPCPQDFGDSGGVKVLGDFEWRLFVAGMSLNNAAFPRIGPPPSI
jgi:hypothetical protein